MNPKITTSACLGWTPDGVLLKLAELDQRIWELLRINRKAVGLQCVN